MDLDNQKDLEKIDQARMRQILADFPRHCELGFQLGRDFKPPKDFAKVKNIVFAGMGGSAIGAELVSTYLRKEIKLALSVNRDYTLPAFVNQESLVILASYSGNTEETLSAYNEASLRRAKMMILTSGGELAESAKKQGHPCLMIPSGFPPRGALAFLALPLLAIFAQLGLIEDKQNQVQEAVTLLTKMEKEALGLAVAQKANPAKQLAQKLFAKFGVIYAGGEQLAAVVTRWRGQLAENSKALASTHLFPEMNHNEIVGWQHPEELLKKFVVILLRDKQDHAQVQKRMEISRELWAKDALPVEEVWSQGQGLLARTLSLVYIGDYVSFYLAALNGEDPTPVKRVEYLKRRLKEL